MKKILYLTLLFALCCVFVGKVDTAHALGSYDLTGVNLTSAGLLTWNNSGFSGDCVANFYGHSGGGGFWGNVGCSTYNSGVNLNDAGFGSTQCPLMTDYGMSGACCFTLNNYNGQGMSHCVPIYYTGGTSWSLTYVPPPPSATITSPSNHSTITSNGSTISISYSNVDYTTYPYLIVGFYNESGEWSSAYHLTLTSASGSFSLPYSTFQITENGKWYIYATAWSDARGSGWGTASPLITANSFDLTFNISGLPTPFSFTDYPTWYSSNVSNYSSPSDWSVAMQGYLKPIFEKIGEFSNRITEYLNVSDAYNKGNSIGLIFPIAFVYINSINAFFGGFPIAQLFEWGILIFLGLFIVKIILKLLSFIPFVGGGG